MSEAPAIGDRLKAVPRLRCDDAPKYIPYLDGLPRCAPGCRVCLIKWAAFRFGKAVADND